MKKKIGLLFSIIFLVCSSFTSSASFTPVQKKGYTSTPALTFPNHFFHQYIISLNLKELKKIIGRRLTFKEKLGFKLYQHQLKRQLKNGEASGNNGTTSLVLGIAGIAALFIPYVQIAAIPCLILALIFGYNTKRKFPKNKDAKTGILLGWIGLGLVAAAFAVVLTIFTGGF